MEDRLAAHRIGVREPEVYVAEEVRCAVRDFFGITPLPVGKCLRWLSSARRRWGRNIKRRSGHAGYRTVGFSCPANDGERRSWPSEPYVRNTSQQ
jgi:hypothetical protein